MDIIAILIVFLFICAIIASGFFSNKNAQNDELTKK
ncbi:MAG: hypothetical protein RLZZ210_1284, partial [Pseudomonadota bacterium]